MKTDMVPNHFVRPCLEYVVATFAPNDIFGLSLAIQPSDNNAMNRSREAGRLEMDNQLSRLGYRGRYASNMQSESITLRETLNLVDVRGGDFDTLILSRGKPLAINWHDCAGSVAQYLVRAGVSDYEDELASLRHVLDGNIDPDAELVPQIELFLQLLAPATYTLAIDSFNISDMIEPHAEWNPAKDYDNFYPIDTTLVLTQPTSSLNDTTIKEYVAKIKSGKRPIVLAVTTKDAWCNYVIDGHHKLVAYRKLNTKPTVLSAYRMSPPPLPRDTFTEWFPANHPLASHYSKNKRK